jgi:hypothetical protein
MDWDREEEIEVEGRERISDPSLGAAKIAILRRMSTNVERVFYRQQLEVILESAFFHWITGKALNELESEGRLKADLVSLTAKTKIKVYRLPSNRYWKRGAAGVARVVRQFSEGPLVRALGDHGELMVDQALSRAGFTIEAENVRRWFGQEWSKTDHDLDRVYVKDGLRFGAEIKNTLKYIPKDEFEIKLAMCRALDLVPLFVVRMLPKEFIYRVGVAGGFCLILKWQMYPFGFEPLAAQVRAELELPVDCPRRIEAGTVQRLLNWHTRRVAG